MQLSKQLPRINLNELRHYQFNQRWLRAGHCEICGDAGRDPRRCGRHDSADRQQFG